MIDLPSAGDNVLRMKIALITAGGAGMFCGSCMQDNTLARALRLCGADAFLIPTYTPITVDEDDASSGRVFMGGINVYLDSMLPGWKWLPRILKRPLDSRSVVAFLSRFSGSTDAAKLGPLTVDMLRGAAGPQRSEMAELCNALTRDIRPDVILFSNALLSGLIPELRAQFSGPIHVILQGDDIFLNALPERYRTQAIDLIRTNCQSADTFLTHSDYYSEYMGALLQIPRERVLQIPLSLDISEADLSVPRNELSRDEFTVGYFARICPEKGIHHLLEVAPEFLTHVDDARIVIAGYLPEQHRRWFQTQFQRAARGVGEGRIEWLGSPQQRIDKLRILAAMDVMCLPTEYHEPKGLPVLEAAFTGTPSVLPRHGAFPERIHALGAGYLYEPGSTENLLGVLKQAAGERDVLQSQRETLISNVRRHHAMESSGQAVMSALEAKHSSIPGSGSAI